MTIFLAIIIFILALECTSYISHSLSDWLIKTCVILFGLIIPTGYLAASFDLINKPFVYLGLVLFELLLIYTLIRFYSEKVPINVAAQSKYLISRVRDYWQTLGLYKKLTIAILGLTTIVVSIINLIVLTTTYPNEWDSMTGHLVKCAYYLQNGNMDRLQGTSWTIDFYPNSLPTLQIFGYHIFGEKGFKLVHYISYWVFALTASGVAGLLFGSKKAKGLVFLISLLLPSALIQAVTTETDIVQSAYLGVVVYLLLSIHINYKRITLYWFVLATCIWISHKVTFLLIGPAFFVIFVYIIAQHLKRWKDFVPAIGLFVIGLLIYVLPNGYYANIKEVGKFSLGALSAPAEVMKWHGVEAYSSDEKIKNMKLNAMRYTSDFIQLDGIRNTPMGEKFNEYFRIIPNAFFDKFDLEREEFWVVAPFEIMGDPRYKFYLERPFWGIISFILVPIALIMLVFRRKRYSHFGLITLFFGAFLIHFLSLCYSAPYDPIKGRYFMNASIWLIPLLGVFALSKKSDFLLLVSSIFIAWAAVPTLTHRRLYPLQGENSIFELNRIEQITVIRPDFTDAYEKFEKLVPENAIVALGTQQEHEDYIYPLWGKEFKRTLIPIHPFRSKVKAIPKEAQYLFYSEGVIAYKNGDILLGEGDKTPDTPVPESKYYLRKLR